MIELRRRDGGRILGEVRTGAARGRPAEVAEPAQPTLPPGTVIRGVENSRTGRVDRHYRRRSKCHWAKARTPARGEFRRQRRLSRRRARRPDHKNNTTLSVHTPREHMSTITMETPSDVADMSKAALGKKRILWADSDMPVLARVRKRFAKDKPLKGLKMACCLHVTAETANLTRTLQAGGAEVMLIASNPLSTQDDVGRQPGQGLRHPRQRHPRRRRRHLLQAHRLRPRIRTEHHHGRRGRPRFVDGLRRPQPARRRARTGAYVGAEDSGGPARRLLQRRHRLDGRDDDRRHPPAGDGEGRRSEVPGHLRE